MNQSDDLRVLCRLLQFCGSWAVISFSGRDPAQLVFACKIQVTVSVCSHLASGGKDQKCNRYRIYAMNSILS